MKAPRSEPNWMNDPPIPITYPCWSRLGHAHLRCKSSWNHPPPSPPSPFFHLIWSTLLEGQVDSGRDRICSLSQSAPFPIVPGKAKLDGGIRNREWWGGGWPSIPMPFTWKEACFSRPFIFNRLNIPSYLCWLNYIHYIFISFKNNKGAGRGRGVRCNVSIWPSSGEGRGSKYAKTTDLEEAKGMGKEEEKGGGKGQEVGERERSVKMNHFGQVRWGLSKRSGSSKYAYFYQSI